MTKIQEVVNYYYELKDMSDMGSDWYEENNVVYSRFTRPAKELIDLCDNDIEKVKRYMEKIAGWADGFSGDWQIETVMKKYLELEAGMI